MQMEMNPMRTILFVAAAALVTSLNGTAQQSSHADGLACFENLAAPEFPQAALHQHVDGSVWTWTHVNAQGIPEKIDTQVVSAWGDGPKLLIPPVEKAIHAAKVNPACAGKTVSVVFRYELHGEAIASPKVTSRNQAPNIMYIESQPEGGAVTTSKTSGKTSGRS
jgi:hypothetical protein